MASVKKITMREYNGTDYDTLYPKTIASQVDGVYTKEESISASTRTALGLATNAIPDAAFAKIAQQLSESGIVRMVKLWENANFNSNFAGQSISLDLSKYDEIEVRFILWSDNALWMLPTIKCKIGTPNLMYCSTGGATPTSGGLCIALRTIVTSSNSVVFSDGYVYSPINTDSTGRTLNNWLIPYQIHGLSYTV